MMIWNRTRIHCRVQPFVLFNLLHKFNARLNEYQLITNNSVALLGYRQHDFHNGLLIGCENNMQFFLLDISGIVA